MIKTKLKKKILNNLNLNKKNYFTDGKQKIFYKDILKKLRKFETFIKLKDIKNKKILAVIYNETGVCFWINILISFISGITVMPLKKKK